VWILEQEPLCDDSGEGQQMSKRTQWIIVILLCLVGIALLWVRQSKRSALFAQIDSTNAMPGRVAAARQLLDQDVIPAALPAQQIIVRSKTAEVLAEVRTPKAIDVLIGLLSDTEDAPRRWARTALVKIGTPALPALSQTLIEGDDNAKKLAVEALTAIGKPAIPYLRRLLSDATARANACLCLGNIGAGLKPDEKTKIDPATRQEALIPLIDTLPAPDADLANAAIPVLGDKRVQEAVEPLRQALKIEGLRPNTIAALGEISDPKATLDLIPFIANATLRDATTRALGQIGDVRAAAPLAVLMDSRSKDYRSTLVLALQHIGAPAASTILPYLKSQDVYVRRAAALSLSGDKAPGTIPALQQSLADADPEVRAAAANALGWEGNTAAIPSLLKALRDPEGIVSDAALGSLANIRSAAIPTLVSLFSSPDPSMAMYGSQALVSMSDIEGMGERVLASVKVALASPQPQVRIWATNTLSDMDEKIVLPLLPKLHEMYTTSQGDLKSVLAKALRKFGENVALPSTG
jgi:HEAT repeat protein